MTPLAATSGLGPEFDDFLFAVIGDDRNGMPLSVVSVLARVDLDPWHEAASLAAMPGELAARRLAPLLATLSERTLQQASAAITAVRLIALLPHRTNPKIRPSRTRIGRRCGSPSPDSPGSHPDCGLCDSVPGYPIPGRAPESGGGR
jgi:hypothetical protein